MPGTMKKDAGILVLLYQRLLLQHS